MKRTLFPALLICTILVLFISQSFRQVVQSESKEQLLIAKANESNMLFPQEKLYLHIDRPSYWAGEDIWFKAYLKNSPINTSNLYVELLNSAGKVVSRNICWVQEGKSYGDIHLSDTISSGMYQVRAYTNWMRNFGEEYFFRRDLVIWNLQDKAKSPAIAKLIARDVDFRFLPEGGTFLAGIKNKVAFKAVDRNGMGLNVEGVVLDDKGTQVARIKSGFKGMGSVELSPQAGMKYAAEVTIAGNLPMRVELPVASASGVKMSVNPLDTTNIHLEVNEISGNGNASSKYILVGEAEGKVCYRNELAISSGKGVLDIRKEKFPTGIVRFTLFDGNMIPRCERLVFVNRHDQVNVKIEADKEAYSPREKVILDMYAMLKEDVPALANLSVSVYHAETTTQSETYPENILTRFLLSSELKGKVEEPSYYFKDDSLSTTLSLDNVMLTHGYRYFEWKELIDNKKPDISFQPEPSLEISGNIFSVVPRRPLANGKITLISRNKQMTLREVTSDSDGRFVFSNLFFNDTLQVIIQARTEKGKTNADVKIDERSSIPPDATILPVMYQYANENSSNTVTYLSELSPELLNKKWRLSDTILLKDINIMARKIKEQSRVIRPYIEADYVYKVSEKDGTYIDIFDMLENTSARFRSILNPDRAFGQPTKFLDGNMVLDDEDLKLPISWFESIEYVRMAPVKGGFGPGLYFYTKRGVPNEKPSLSPGITPTDLIGYSIIRGFYSPVYDGSADQPKNKNDFRSTLYWNPVIETDEEGTAWVEFYNSDQTGEVQIVVEGVTKEGKLCRGVCKYEVASK